jgi:hypothetical protein
MWSAGPENRGKWLPELSEAENYELPILRQTTREPAVRQRKRDRDRAERVRQAGGPKPTLRERAVAYARARREVRTAELTAIGVPRCYLSKMCEEGLLVKVGHGRYRVDA